jgi:hypothetical protein
MTILPDYITKQIQLNKFLKNNIFILIIYLIFSVIFTYPLMFNLQKTLIGWPLDAFDYLWNIDTFWKQIINLSNPFFTNRIFFPIGSNLIFHTYAPFFSVFALPFLKNLVTYLNIIIILSLPISAFSAFLLSKYLTKNKKASFVAGLVYGFSPIMISFLASQHYHFALAAPFLPIGLLFLTKFLKTGKSKYLFATIIIFWMTLFTEYYTTVLLIFSYLIYSVSVIFLEFKKSLKLFEKNYLEYLLAIIIFLIIPLISISLLLFRNSNIIKFAGLRSYYPAFCSTKINNLFTPSQFNPLLKFVAEKRDFSDTPSLFVGWIIPIIALSSFFLKKLKATLPLFLIGICVFLFSLGPQTFFFKIVVSFPFLGLIDCPQRFLIGSQLILALLLGISLDIFTETKFAKLIFPFILIVFFIEYSTINLPFSKVEIPNVYNILAKSKDNLTILELPSGIAESKGAFGYDWSVQGLLLKQKYWQTIHNKPRIGGYLSRVDSSIFNFFKNEPVISDLFTMSSLNGKWSNKIYNKSEINKFMAKFNLGYIILSPNPRQEIFTKIIQQIFGDRIVQKIESEGYVLYKLN